MNINEFANLTKLSKQTIRYYESIGLLKPQRSNNRYRTYQRIDLNDAQIITALKHANMSLDDIKIVIGLKRREVTLSCKEDTLQFLSKYQHSIEQQIMSLQRILGIFSSITIAIGKSEQYDEEKLVQMISELHLKED